MNGDNASIAFLDILLLFLFIIIQFMIFSLFVSKKNLQI